jgi:hypothetical protein
VLISHLEAELTVNISVHMGKYSDWGAWEIVSPPTKKICMRKGVDVKSLSDRERSVMTNKDRLESIP